VRRAATILAPALTIGASSSAAAQVPAVAGEDPTPYITMCCAGVGISLLLGLTFFLIVRSARSGQRKQGAAWARAARGLGLSLGEWTPEMRSGFDRLTGAEAPEEPMTTQPMRGSHAGRSVVVQVRMRRGSYSSPNPADRLPTYWTEAATELDPPLVARLRVRTREGAVDDLGGLGVAEAVRAAYEITALDEDYGLRLLADPEVARALIDGTRLRGRLRIADGAVVAVLDGLVTDEGALRGALDLATRVASALEGARARIAPPAAVAALDGPWGELARSRGWSHDRTTGRLTGRREGLRFELRAEPLKEWRTGVTVWLAAPAGLGLWLSREGALSGVARFIGMQDIEVGDPRFDGRFIVQGRPEAAVRALLTEPVRDTLIAIQDQALRFEVKDDHVVALVGHLMTDPGQIDDALAHLGFVARELSASSPAAGPYRA
jgi:hypothetical protein